MKTPLEHHARRREAVSAQLGGGLLIVPAAKLKARNAGNDFPFRQDSDFFALTGFDEPDALAILHPSHPTERYVLFVRPSDAFAEMWTGRRAGVAGAVETYGADAAYPISELAKRLREHLVDADAIYYRLGNSDYDDRMIALLAESRLIRGNGGAAPDRLVDPSPLLHDLRLRKSPEELDVLRQACVITADGHREAMQVAAGGMWEYQVQAAMEYRFRLGGSPRSAYDSIVASGANACILHYSTNDARIGESDLILVDAGAELGYMSADITRTFPASGTFTDAQAELYGIVLAANIAAIDAVRPGVRIAEVHMAARKQIAIGLESLGLLPSSVDEALKMNLDREFFPHGTSHWLGMDVHDVGGNRVQGASRELEPGMVITVEPGLYFAPERAEVTYFMHPIDEQEVFERRVKIGTAAAALEKKERDAAPTEKRDIPDRYRGIGIRIEDDVVVTSSGHEVLTSEVPKALTEVQDLCREAATGGPR